MAGNNAGIDPFKTFLYGFIKNPFIKVRVIDFDTFNFDRCLRHNDQKDHGHVNNNYARDDNIQYSVGLFNEFFQ